MKLLLCLCLSLNLLSFNVHPPKTSFNDSASSSLVVDGENRILYAHNPDKTIYPASMTKLMTALVALDQNPDFSRSITITPDMIAGLKEMNASRMEYQIGDEVDVDTLFHAVLMVSAADAVNALAIDLCGTVERFVEKMNEKAESLSMNHTSFTNPTGLHDMNHYSTVKDMYLLLKECANNPYIVELLQCESFLFRSKNQPRGVRLYSRSQAAFHDTESPYYCINFIGGKTGFTGEAGYCLASLWEDEGEWLYMVEAGCPQDGGYESMIDNSLKLYKHISDNYSTILLSAKGDSLFEGKKDGTQLNLMNPADIEDYVPQNSEVRFEFTHDLPIQKGEQLGLIKIESNGQCLSVFPYYATEDIDASLWVKIYRWFQQLLP